VQVSGLTGVTAVAAGTDFSLALKSDGTVWAWGDNTYGQLGDGTSGTDRLTPVPVTGLSGVTVRAISAGVDHSMALGSDGVLRAWGNNSQGQLGNGTNTASSTPVQLGSATNVLAVSAGNQFTVILVRYGLSSTVWGWGDNSQGQLGNGTTSVSWTPVQASGLSYMSAVAAGSDHSLALKSDGTMWAWGNNSQGQLGINSTSPSYTPVQTRTPPVAVQAITAGYQDSFAATTAGTVWAWGDDTYGKLGDIDTVDKTSPVPITLP
jgi:alpha-tubulin suppressor-like RCC1 family protein